MSVRRGEIYMTELPDVGENIQHGYRPVVVIQNNIGNKYSPTTVVVAVTTKKDNKWYLPTHIRINKQPGVRENSKVLCEQVHTVNQSKLENKIGILSRRKIIELNIAMAVSVIPALVEVACKYYKVKNKAAIEKGI